MVIVDLFVLQPHARLQVAKKVSPPTILGFCLQAFVALPNLTLDLSVEEFANGLTGVRWSHDDCSNLGRTPGDQ
jgi:hypothetical protein